MRIYYGWIIVAAALLIEMFSWGISTTVTRVFAQTWVTEFDISRSQVMLPAMLAQFGAAACAPLVGLAVRKWPIGFFQMAGGVIVGLALMAATRSSAMWQVTLLFAVPVALGLICTGPMISQSLIVNWFRENRGTAVGIVSMGPGLGIVVMPPLVVLLFENFGWRTAMLILGGVVLVAVPAIALLFVRTPKAAEQVSADVDSADIISAPDWTWRQILTDRVFWADVLLVTPFYTIVIAISENISLYMADRAGSLQATGFLLSASGAALMIGGAIIGMIADRLPFHKLALAITVLSVGLLVALCFRPSLPLTSLTICSLFFLAGGIITLQYLIFAWRYGTHSFAPAIGLVVPLNTLCVLGSVVLAAIRDAFGSYEIAFAFLLFCPAMALIGTLILRREHIASSGRNPTPLAGATA